MKTYNASDLSLRALVGLYNTVAERPVISFRDKATAVSRVEKLAEGRGAIIEQDGMLMFGDLEEDTDDYALEPTEQRETRLAGLSFNEAEERDAAAPQQPTTLAALQASAALESALRDPAPVPASAPASAQAKRRGPPAAYADTAVITLVSPLSAARRGQTPSSARYALYRDGMTVGEYLDAAGALQGNRGRWRADIVWDVKHGHIKVGA